MTSDPSAPPRIFSRRDLLRTAGAVGAAALTADTYTSAAASGAPAQDTPPAAPAAAPREAFERLTAAEADTLEAVVGRLIPSDEHGPGATEARAAHYIDRALGGALSGSLESYRGGLAALDRHARAAHGRGFAVLGSAEQDALLGQVEAGAAAMTGFADGAAAFFALVKAHTWQGTFGDPYYGGNANFVGWDLLGYPGVRTLVTVEDQRRLEQHALPANHRSAYDDAGFTKAIVRGGAPGGHAHGD